MKNFLTKLFSRRSIENPAVPIYSDEAYDYLVSNPSASGVPVNRESILGIHAIWRGVNLVTQKVAGVPSIVYERKEFGRQPAKNHPAYKLLKYRANNSGLNIYEFKQAIQFHAMVYGNGYARIYRDGSADPLELEILDPEETYPVIKEGNKLYRTTGDSYLLPENVIHIKGLSYDGVIGISILDVLRDQLGLSLGIQKYTSVYFKNSGRPGIVIELPASLKDPIKIERFRKTFGAIHQGLDNAHKIALLESGAKIVSSPTDNDSTQLVELTDKQIIAAANILGVPPAMLGVSDSYTSHNSLESQQQQFLSDTLDGWLNKWEQELSNKLLRESEKLNDSHYVEFNRDTFTKTDRKTENEILLSQLKNGAISWEEYRQKKNYSTDRAGQIYFLSTGVVRVDEDFAPVTPEPPTPTPPTEPAQPPPEPPIAPAQQRLEALTDKTVSRLVKRVQKAVEAGKTEVREHQEIFLENLEDFPSAETAIDSFFTELEAEVSSICKEDRSKIKWQTYKSNLIGGLYGTAI